MYSCEIAWVLAVSDEPVTKPTQSGGFTRLATDEPVPCNLRIENPVPVPLNRVLAAAIAPVVRRLITINKSVKVSGIAEKVIEAAPPAPTVTVSIGVIAVI